MNSLAGAAMFVAPLLALVAIWAVVVPLFQINPRVFPSVGAVGTAAIESIRDGTLIAHVGASLLRVGLGTADRDRHRRAARHRDGRQSRRWPRS